MADFLTRLIQRSRGLASPGEQVEPLIAPFYAAGQNTAPPDDAMDDAMTGELTSVAEPESQGQVLAPHTTGATLGQLPEEKISIVPSPQRRESREKIAPEIKVARAPADETQSARRDQRPGIEPLPRPATPESQSSPANERPGLAATADQSRRVNAGPLAIRPQSVARANESDSRAGEAASDAGGQSAARLIRVTIGRIDVRAVSQAAPPARRAAPPAPKLSLEEYLRSRSGRKG